MDRDDERPGQCGREHDADQIGFLHVMTGDGRQRGHQRDPPSRQRPINGLASPEWENEMNRNGGVGIIGVIVIVVVILFLVGVIKL